MIDFILEAIKANLMGGGIMGSKSQAKTRAKERLLAKKLLRGCLRKKRISYIWLLCATPI